MIEIHQSALISPNSDIEPSKKGSKIVIGENVIIDSFVKIKPAGGIGSIIIGNGSVINSGCVIYSGNGVRIGKNVAIAANCTLAPVNHKYEDKDIPIVDQGFCVSKGGIIIEDDVWIGAGVVILDGAVIRRGCVIGALSLVRGELPEYSINGGNPIKLLGFRK